MFFRSLFVNFAQAGNMTMRGIEGAAIATVLSQIVQALLTLPLQFSVPGKMNSFAESVQIMNQTTTSKSTAFHIIAITHKWQKIVTKETFFVP